MGNSALGGRYGAKPASFGPCGASPGAPMAPATLARDVGLLTEYITFFFWPTLMFHTTVAGIDVRLEQAADGSLRFKGGPQYNEVDYAFGGAYLLIAVLLEQQNNYFGLGLQAEIDQILAAVRAHWPL
jgi:hypothetical protein